MDPLKHLGNIDFTITLNNISKGKSVCPCLVCPHTVFTFLQSTIWFFVLTFRKTVDQLAEVGFEMIFYSFGSGFNLEADDISGLKADIAYANSKGKIS